MTELSERKTLIVVRAAGWERDRVASPSPARCVAVARTRPSLADLRPLTLRPIELRRLRPTLRVSCDRSISRAPGSDLLRAPIPGDGVAVHTTAGDLLGQLDTDVKIAFTWLREAPSHTNCQPASGRRIISGAALRLSPSAEGKGGGGAPRRKATQRFSLNRTQRGTARGLGITITTVMAPDDSLRRVCRQV